MTTGPDSNESTTSSTDFLSGSGRKPGGANNLRLVSNPSTPSPTCSDDNDPLGPSRGIFHGLLLAAPMWVVFYLVVKRLL